MSDRNLKRGDAAEVKTPAESIGDVTSEAPSQTGEASENKASTGWLSPRGIGLVSLSILGPLLALTLGLYLYLSGGRYISTDNAYVKSDKIAVSSDISGRVSEVMVRANQVIAPGKLLFRIDPEPFQIAVDQAKAGLLAARQEGAALKSLYLQKLAGIKRAKVDLAFLEKRYARQSRLKRKAITTQSSLETADQNLQMARAQLGALEQDLAQALVRLGGRTDTPIDHLTGVMAAAAALRRAELNLKHTAVHASLDGVITNFDLQKGEFVEAGKAVFSIVGSRELWIQANFRETDMTHMLSGQLATISVDAYPGEKRKAQIDSIDPATGAEFALLPAQNATGNWVKVVQRLPVRLKLQAPPRDAPLLRAGMSVIVTVDTGHERTLGGLISWFGTKIGG